jgi:hypothetical protein
MRPPAFLYLLRITLALWGLLMVVAVLSIPVRHNKKEIIFPIHIPKEF